MARRIVLMVAAAGLLLAACGAGDGESAAGFDAGQAGETGAAGLAPATVTDPFGEDAALEGEAFPGEGVEVAIGAAALPGVGLAVIKTAEVELEVDRDGLKEAVQAVTTAAATHGGFIASSSIAGHEGGRATVVLRVPAERFEQALASIRDLGRIEGEAVSSEDVSQEFVDLEARLRNLAAQETVILGLMEEAGSIAESIRVQKELTTIQLEIERIRGRLGFLEDRTALSTIAVRMTEEGAAPAPASGPIQRGWQRAVDAFLAIVGGAVASLGVVLPIGVLLAALWLAARALRPRWAGRPGAAPPA